MILAWIAGRSAERSAEGRRTFPKEVLYSRAVQVSLGQCTLLPPQFAAPRNSAEWEYHIRALHQRCLGLALLKAGGGMNDLLVLSDAEKIQMEYYMFTDSNGSA
jgi:hypothetical protein